MNERFRELAEQQGLTGPNYLISSQELEKFAELIVRECIRLCDQVVPDPGANDCIDNIKQHFGVKE
jgi:hypothetical protein